MKEIKAFIHRNRIADVVHALRSAGFRNISMVDVQGMLTALDSREQRYSIEFGEAVITEVKLELVCVANQVANAVEIIRRGARTGRQDAGWIYVSTIDESIPIDAAERTHD